MVVGLVDGFNGLFAEEGGTRRLDEDSVQDIQSLGGTILGTANRGNPFRMIVRDAQGRPQRGEDGAVLTEDRSHEAVDRIKALGLDGIIAIGGDGTLSMAREFHEKFGIPIVGVPKTIDNDISYCSKTFGFETAFSKAVEAVQSAHVEAYGAHYGVVVIKLMGRDSGFIAANTSLACPDVNFVLIPEVRFDLHGPEGMMAAMENSFDEKQKKGQHPHSVIVVAEGAGQYLMSNRI